MKTIHRCCSFDAEGNGKVADAEGKMNCTTVVVGKPVGSYYAARCNETLEPGKLEHMLIQVLDKPKQLVLVQRTQVPEHKLELVHKLVPEPEPGNKQPVLQQ